MKKYVIIIILLLGMTLEAGAVLKEKNLDSTLVILRSELTKYYQELTSQREQRKQQREAVFQSLTQTMKQSNQNALMLYSQKQEYLFDLTYACHQATEQYQQFQRQQLPFREFINNTSGDIARYDSLINSLSTTPLNSLSEQARIDRSVCLTLATVIKRTLEDDSQQMADYIRIYDMTEQRLKHMNDYAQKRYYDIQTSIFVNGGDTYFGIIRNFRQKWQMMKEVVTKKYTTDEDSQKSDWNVYWIIGLFMAIGFYALIAIGLNMLAFRFMPKRLHTEEFLKKRSSIMWTTTAITLAIIMGLLRHYSEQNFFIMASGLLVEYLWLLAVILISLLLRVKSDQIHSAFRIYAPLLTIGFVVITFRIILIPSELVSIFFPPILLGCMIWQWLQVRRHNQNIPRSDMFYTYISLTVFIASAICSWAGYTLLAVQLLIWWIMQLTCILTITCISDYLKMYEKKHGFADKPVTQTWFLTLIHKVVIPVLIVCSVMISIYWAADVFNLSDMCKGIFNEKFINQKNLQVSIVKLAVVISSWFLFSWISKTVLSLMRLHFETKDPTTAESKAVMGKNVVQLIIWGVWLLAALAYLHISVSWLLAISGGLSTGIGFASKDIIENIYYGASLMTGRIKVGDWIQVDGTMGKVASISYTSTVIESLYGEVITFQNAQLFSKNYKNLTRNHGYVLVVVPFGVAYGSNLKQVTELVETAVNDMHHKWIDKTKKVKSVVSEMADSSINFKLFVWADAPKQSYVVSDVLKCVYDTLNENGIQIPFPQRDIHLISE
ncbi:MAG: mechanosensitive ion channel family protein [Prevotella sp.]|jgi:small-conductance mechanosensitive channel|nr:mechanosensitive ion channel family protein [Prevotella sp.]